MRIHITIILFIVSALLAAHEFVQADVEVGKSGEAVWLRDENGVPFGVRQVHNKPRVISTPYAVEVALHNITGHDTINVIGYDADTGTVLTDISELTTAVIPIPAAATRVEFSSTDADDTRGGTGVGIVDLHGLDSNFDPISETIDMRGLAVHTSVNSYIRFNAFHSYSVGSTGVAEGTISIKSLGGATEYIRISAGGNKSLSSLFTVPSGKVGIVDSWTPGFATVSNNTIGRALLRATVDYTRDLLIPDTFIFQAVAVGQSSSVNIPITPPLAFPPKTDIKVSAMKVAGTATMAVSSNYNIMIEDQ